MLSDPDKNSTKSKVALCTRLSTLQYMGSHSICITNESSDCSLTRLKILSVSFKRYEFSLHSAPFLLRESMRVCKAENSTIGLIMIFCCPQLGLSVEPHPVFFDSVQPLNVTITNLAPPSPSSSTPSSTPSVIEVLGTDFRLPETLRPLHYTLKVQPFIHGNETMNGTVVMELEVTRSTSKVTFHVSQMVLIEEDIKVRERGRTYICIFVNHRPPYPHPFY